MAAFIQSQDRYSRKGLNAAILRRLVQYEPETGQFIRLAAPKRGAGKRFGKPAAQWRNENGYVLISLGRRWRFRAHQLAWLYMTGEWPSGDIDHVDGDRANTKWANLRAATRSQNLANSCLKTTNTSGIKGVSWDTKRGLWRSQISNQGRRHFLGRYASKDEAAAAYECAARKLYGEFARMARAA